MGRYTASREGGPPRDRRLWKVLAVSAVLLLGAEGVCRGLGLHTPVLYEPTSYGFRPVPNQNIRRFGNRIFYDGVGLRSEPHSVAPLPGVVRILCLGDSITNGGAVTDQGDTFPYRLTEELAQKGVRAEVLNASSPGWAVANEAIWLGQFGTLNSRYLVWTLNTYDLFQAAAPSGTVGSHPSFPRVAPFLGLQELLFRYLLPRVLENTLAADPGAIEEGDYGEVVLSVRRILGSMIGAVRSQGTEAVIVLIEHPSRMDRQDIEIANLEGLLNSMKVPFARISEHMGGRGGTRLFRDGVHPNPEGNRVIASILARRIASLAAH